MLIMLGNISTLLEPYFIQSEEDRQSRKNFDLFAAITFDQI